MPERLDRVTVVTPNGDVVLSGEVRQELLQRLTNHAPEVAVCFEAVGATRPVELTVDQRASLKHLVSDWLDDDDPPAEVRAEVLELYVSLNRGDPWSAMIEIWDEGDAETGPAFGSATWQWRWAHWDERRDPDDDHQHCLFCHTNIEDDALTEAWLTLGDDDSERWVCAGCFEKLRGRFGWKTNQ